MASNDRTVLLHIKPTPSGLSFPVRVLPRSSRNEIVGVQEDGALKIKLTAPPVEGAANKALCEFIAEKLGVAKSRVTISSGQSSKNKTVIVSGITEAEINQLFS